LTCRLAASSRVRCLLLTLIGRAVDVYPFSLEVRPYPLKSKGFVRLARQLIHQDEPKGGAP